MVFNFHNIVNKKLNKPSYEYINLDKYNHVNITALYNNLNIIYSTKTSNPHLMGISLNKKILFPKIISALLLIKQDLL
jgi:hypothetical protein